MASLCFRLTKRQASWHSPRNWWIPEEGIQRTDYLWYWIRLWLLDSWWVSSVFEVVLILQWFWRWDITSFPSSWLAWRITHGVRNDWAYRCATCRYLRALLIKCVSPRQPKRRVPPLQAHNRPINHWRGSLCLATVARPVIPLQKNKKVKTVVNKLNSIDNQFRFFKMELIAGDADFVVEHVSNCLVEWTSHWSCTQHESDCRFTFDFSQVYWNSRLHTEHDRLVRLFKPIEVVADVFAGVGPFAVPAAKKGCAVLANDLNPNSEKYLAINVKNNQVQIAFSKPTWMANSRD